MHDERLNASAAEQYAGGDLLGAIDGVLARFDPERRLSAAELGPFDQFHSRGFPATVELAQLAGVTRDADVLDLGAGLGGPARYLAETFGARVTAIDTTPAFVEGASRLHARWSGPAANVTYGLGDALHLDANDASYDLVWMQHVAMNIADRDALYREVHRVLRPGGRFATYDVVAAGGDLHYPTPWARSADVSTVIDPATMRAALERAGLRILTWLDDTPAALEWARSIVAAPPDAGAFLQAVMGPSAGGRVGNLARNLLEGRAGIAAVVAVRD